MLTPCLAASSVILALTLVGANLLDHPKQLSLSAGYDYIVVGAGPGGSVVASRLSEDPKVKVLLVEAGGNDSGIVPVEIPFLTAQLFPDTPYTWNYTTTPQTGLSERNISYPRGRLLGGSSSINFMVYTRGSSDEFDRIARVTADKAWSWNALLPFMKLVENWNVSYSSKFNQKDSAIHGCSGPLSINLPGTPSELDSRVLKSTQEIPEFPLNEDMNSGHTLGIVFTTVASGYTQSTINDGARDNSAQAYIRPALGRHNLDILVHTQVIKLVQTGTEGSLPAFRGVQFSQSSHGVVHALNATREVILSAGSINSPQILLLSGIGPQKHLESMHIDTIVDLPGVGENLQDHPLLSNQFVVNSTQTIESIDRNATLAGELVEQWTASRTGRLVDSPVNTVGWMRLPKDADIFKKVQDPSAGPRSAHYQFIFVDGFVSYARPPPTSGYFMSVFTNVVSPTSRGSVTLASSDPFAAPNIDPGFLTTDFDMFTMREAVKALKRFVAAPAWRDYIIRPADDFAKATSDATIDAWARNTSATVWHPVGTTRMAPYEATDGVVNPDLTVKGTRGLRVVDAGVLPFVPAAHPQAAVYIIAERAVTLIKASYNK